MHITLNKKYVRFANMSRKVGKITLRRTVMIDAFNLYKLQQLQGQLIEKTNSTIIIRPNSVHVKCIKVSFKLIAEFLDNIEI